MATEITVPGTEVQAKVRNPLGVLGLALITFGIYGIFWYYFINKEMAQLGKSYQRPDLGESPGMSVLAVTLGAFILVPPFVSIYNTTKRINAAQSLAGAEQSPSAGLNFVLWLFLSPVAIYLTQDGLNKAWQRWVPTATA